MNDTPLERTLDARVKLYYDLHAPAAATTPRRSSSRCTATAATKMDDARGAAHRARRFAVAACRACTSI
jgi:hypothetical protein